tara:strand:- start:9141 stop:9851 length:711 start_codon:yes stop_codon:yes gene_type:complete
MGTDNNWIKLIKKEEVCNLFNKLTISTKSITLFAGENTIGKTATCLHLAKLAIDNGHSVLYFDTEEKIIDRPDPNLLATFLQQNPKGFSNKFNIQNKLLNKVKQGKLDTSYFEQKIKENKPVLVIIDSIYTAFAQEFPEARRRAKVIGEFMLYLRPYMKQNNLAIIITSKTGRIVDRGEEKETILGGQELLYNCDVKAKMTTTHNNHKVKRVIFEVDQQQEFVLTVDYGGGLKESK